MMVDLNRLTIQQSFELMEWCVSNQVDIEHASRLLEQWYAVPGDDGYDSHVNWILDIPEEHLTYFMLKWS